MNSLDKLMHKKLCLHLSCGLIVSGGRSPRLTAILLLDAETPRALVKGLKSLDIYKVGKLDD